MLCKQLGSKDLSVSLWTKLKELTLMLWTMNSKNDSPRCDLFTLQTKQIFLSCVCVCKYCPVCVLFFAYEVHTNTTKTYWVFSITAVDVHDIWVSKRLGCKIYNLSKNQSITLCYSPYN
jgi:hypothetical protein